MPIAISFISITALKRVAATFLAAYCVLHGAASCATESNAAGANKSAPEARTTTDAVQPGAAHYADIPSAKLWVRSWNSPSDSEKAAIRQELAAREPDSEFGLAARAWLISTQSDDSSQSAEFLARCVVLNPNNLYCRSALAIDLWDLGRAQEAIAQYLAIRRIDPAFNDRSADRYLYFVYHDLAKDSAAAEAYLDSLRKGHPDDVNVLVIEAQTQLNSGHAKAAEALYEKAVAVGTLDFDVHQALADLRFDELAKKEPEKREQALEEMLDFAQQAIEDAPQRPELTYQAYRYVARRLARDLKQPEKALDYFALAFERYPTPEVLAEAYEEINRQVVSSSDYSQLAALLVKASDRALPNSSPLLAVLGQRAASENNLNAARGYFERAVAYGATPSERARMTIRLAQTVYEDGLLDFDTARKLLASSLAELPADYLVRGELLEAMYVDRLDAGDFPAALTALDDLEAFRKQHGGARAGWFDDRRRQVQRYIAEDLATRAVDDSGFLRPVAQNASANPVATNGALTVSPDGRYIAFGTYPMQLWDTRTHTKIRDLGRAGDAKFSPDGRYIAASSGFVAEGGYKTNELIVYDVASGKVRARDVVAGVIYDFDWDPSGTRIAYAGDGLGPTIYDVVAKKRIRKAAAPGNMVVQGITWTAQNQIVTGQARDKCLLVWNADTLEITMCLPGVSWPQAVGRSANSRYVVALDNRRVLSVWDTESWELRQARVDAWAGKIIANPKGTGVLLTENGKQPGSVLYFDLRTMRTLAHHGFSGASADLAFDPTGKLIYAGNPDGIALLDAASLKVRSQWTSIVTPRGAVSDVRNGRFISYDDKGVHVWDVAAARLKADLPWAPSELYPVTGQDSRFVARLPYVDGVGTRLTLFDSGSLKNQELFNIDGRVHTLAAAGDLVAVGHTGHAAPNDRQPVDFAGTVEIYSLSRGRRIRTFDVPIATEELRHDSITVPAFARLSLSADGSRLLVLTSWADGFGTGEVDSKQARIYSTRTGKLLQAIDTYKDMTDALFDATDPQLIRIVTKSGTRTHDLTTGALVSRSTARSGEVVVPLSSPQAEIRHGRTFIELHTADGKPRYLAQADNLVSLGVFESLKRVVLLNEANEVSFHELER